MNRYNIRRTKFNTMRTKLYRYVCLNNYLVMLGSIIVMTDINNTIYRNRSGLNKLV
jgi:hypothetical protein